MIRIFYLIASIAGGLNALSLILMDAAYPFGLSFFALSLSLILFFSLVILSDAPRAQNKQNSRLPVSLLRNLQSSSQQKFHAKIQNLFQKPFFIWCVMGFISVPALSLWGGYHMSMTFNHFFIIGALCFLTKMAIFQWKSTRVLIAFLGILFLIVIASTLIPYIDGVNDTDHLIAMVVFAIIPSSHLLHGLSRQAPHRGYAMLGILSFITMVMFLLLASAPLWLWLIFWPLIWACAFRSRPRAAKTYRQFQQ